MAVLNTIDRRCPRDGALLKPVLFNRGTLHYCEQCHGSFAPGAVVTDVPRIASWFAAQPEGAAALPDGELPCPEGHGAMHELRLDKTHQLNLCATCRGIWFDADELKRIDQHSSEVSRGDPNARVNNSNIVSDSAEAADNSGLLDGAFELLGDIVSGIDISF